MAEINTEKPNVTIDWRESLNSHEHDLYMLEHGIATDCMIVVGPDNGDEPNSIQEFKAHRVHLIRASPVFEAMLLQCQMSEAITGRVRVTDLKPRTFHLLLRLVYGASVDELTSKELCDVALAADKYQMKGVFKTCMTLLCKKVSTESIWDSLQLAQLVQHEELKETCVRMLQRYTVRMVGYKDFLQVPEDCVALLLQQDELNVESEMVLVSATVNWARCEAQRRGLTGDDASVRDVLKPRLLQLLRLLTLSSEQFALGPGLSGWLTDEEKEQISQAFKISIITLPPHISTERAKRRSASPVYPLTYILTSPPYDPTLPTYRPSPPYSFSP